MSCCSKPNSQTAAPAACCAPVPKESKLTAENEVNSTQVYSSVQQYYGKVLSTNKDLKTSACCSVDKPHPTLLAALKDVPEEIIAKFYGCGNPIPFGINGLRVLDLGCGAGRDCFLAAKLVGANGSVTGVDFTDEQLQVAQKYREEYAKKLGYAKSNINFVKGYIEHLKEAGIQEGSIDIAISNCVVNLSPDKKSVLKGVYNALTMGGEFYFSDVYCDRRLPLSVQKHEVLWGECISGALYINDFKRLCHEVGFTDPRMLSITPIEVRDPELLDLVGNAKFYSILFRLFKLPALETLCEDYGQVAIYKGTIPEHKHAYRLDDHHVFETNRPVLVCGNTASMVGESWLKPHFQILGDRAVHYGQFDCSPAASSAPSASTSASAGACGPGGCC